MSRWDARGRDLRRELGQVFPEHATRPLPERRFEDLSLGIFAYQYERNPVYGAYCHRIGRTPATVTSWADVPAVPTAAFEAAVLVVDGEPPEATFRTSGTSRGPQRRGEHHVRELALYRAAAMPVFEAFLLPDGARLPVMSLIPPPVEAADSSLSRMVGWVAEEFGADGSAFAISASGELREHDLSRALRIAESGGRPIMLVGTSLAFVHWLERLRATGERFRLPPGSRLMDTGGMKGATRTVGRDALLAAYEELLGLPGWRCVNEYGMTELSSQLYEPVLREGRRSPDRPPRWRSPGWLRTVATDPETLDILPTGESGLLRHWDLANLGSVQAIQTEDLGRVSADAIEIHGRVPGAMPRGCSIAMDLLMEARGEAS